MPGKVIIISAPSGAGKTTIVKHLLSIEKFRLAFSISACTRSPRNGEVNGKDYHFISVDQFQTLIEEDAFVEWEEVYKNNYYGTLKKEVERIWENKQVVLFDVDVVGGANLKAKYKDEALALFIMPPSLEVLEQRLRQRGTEAEEKIKNRINKAKLELKYSGKFDEIIVNNDLCDALQDTEKLLEAFLNKTE